ncbi:MAG: 1-acyl-sn-glycerol-3-phosphate acyltransferase [Planctomycetales bacterium]|nr:1-acyl-sn-glycerol-3-phosphate acyltransferase [Planctomycetales bacterium]
MSRTWLQRTGYDLSWMLCRVVARTLFRAKILHAERSKIDGGLLVCANHQSFFDPVIVGLACRRRLCYLARASLFRHWLFARIIRFYEAIPIEREGIGIGGIKETLRRLKQSRAVLIFPEGTRTHDGSLQPLKPGFCSLVRRTKVPILPVALDGAYEAWPREAKFPRLSKLSICFAEPIDPETVAQLTDEGLVELVTQRIQDSLDEARRQT